LAVARFVRPDLASRLEVENMGLRFATPLASSIDHAFFASYGRGPIRFARVAVGRTIFTLRRYGTRRRP
jgi:hypothetical protein